jgi:hypothetical protein
MKIFKLSGTPPLLSLGVGRGGLIIERRDEFVDICMLISIL